MIGDRLPKMAWSMKYDTPDRMLMYVNNLNQDMATKAAEFATRVATLTAPKLSGAMSGRFTPVSGPGYFGIQWADQYAWFQEVGIRPFTMTRLAGKTIPMWITDYTGQLRRDNPKAKTRGTADGRIQVLIFRRAAKIGQRKSVVKMQGGTPVVSDVPASYPGAPGRIVRRVPPSPDTPAGLMGGWIAKGNVGVRWRHPGLGHRMYLQAAILTAAQSYNLDGYIKTLRGEEVTR